MANGDGQWSSGELEELKKLFFAQAYDIVDALQDAMLKLEADPADAATLKTVKRHIHTLKGDSHSIGLGPIGALCHRMEDVLSVLLEDGQAGHDAVDLLLSCIDAVYELLVKSESGKDTVDAGAAIGRIDGFLSRSASDRSCPLRPALTEYERVRLSGDRAVAGGRVYELEVTLHPQCGEKNVAAFMVLQRFGGMGTVMRAAPDPASEELGAATVLTVLLSTDQDIERVRQEALLRGIVSDIRIRGRRVVEQRDEGGTAPPAPSRARSELLRVDAARVDRIMDLVGELIIGRSMIEQVSKEIEAGASAAEAAARLFAVNAYLERTVSDLQKGAMKMRMVPVHHVFRRFPKMVRDLAAERGKLIRLELRGADTELDKGIVDSLGEPLAHIIRNMVDHGIEGAEERQTAGKTEEGTIVLRAFHEASQIVIEASDDGRGIDTGKLRRKAVEKGFLAPGDAERMQDAEAVNLVFHPGLSTAETVTETSGRGVGMDAVKSAVETMKGFIEIETAPGRGSLFRLRLPLTLAVIKVLLFEAGGRLYAVPVSAVAEVAKVLTDELVTVNGRKTLLLRDQVISLVALDELFRTGASGARKKFVLILAAGGRRTGLLIDRLLWQQELVIKAVDGRQGGSDLIAGASILGDGKVILILDIHAVCRKAVNEERRRLVPA